jgi:DNA-binding XRE family transcriptional regulator
MASIVLTRQQREAIEKAKAEGKRRVRMELTPAQREAMARSDAEVEREKDWIDAKSKDLKQKHDAQIQHIATLLRTSRVEAGLSLSQLAQRTGMTRQAISRIESGENHNPTMSTIVRLAEALNKQWVIDLQDVA